MLETQENTLDSDPPRLGLAEQGYGPLREWLRKNRERLRIKRYVREGK